MINWKFCNTTKESVSWIIYYFLIVFSTQKPNVIRRIHPLLCCSDDIMRKSENLMKMSEFLMISLEIIEKISLESKKIWCQSAHYNKKENKPK